MPDRNPTTKYLYLLRPPSKNIFCLLFRKFIFGKKTEVKFSTFAEGMAHGGVGASGKVSGRYTDKNLRVIFPIFVTEVWKGLRR